MVIALAMLVAAAGARAQVAPAAQAEADRIRSAVREQVEQRRSAGLDRDGQRLLRRAETALRKADRRKDGDPDNALKHARRAEQALARLDSGGKKVTQ